MNHYDVIIIGAGIAGCGLAYNLKKLGYGGSVLVLEKESVGSNVGFGYRNVREESVKEFNIPYIHKYKELRFDMRGYDLKVPINFYFVNYKEMCNHFLSKSSSIFKKEYAISLKKDKLITNKGRYKFQYLIDCSGVSYFIRKLFGLQLPFKYYIGKLHEVSFKHEIPKDYFYFHSNVSGYVEDFYPLKNKILHGDWWLSDDINFDAIKLQEYDLVKRFGIDRNNFLDHSFAIEPISPVYPISSKRYAFLGDSFGNATAVGEGVYPILESGKILADCIKKNQLSDFQRLWKKKYMASYQNYLAAKMHPEDRLILAQLLENYPHLLKRIFLNEKFRLPLNILRKIPKRIILKEIYHRLKLKLKYFFMERRSDKILFRFDN